LGKLSVQLAISIKRQLPRVYNCKEAKNNYVTASDERNQL